MKSIPILDKIPELDLAIEAVHKAGNVILEIYQRKYEITTKSDNSPITEADLTSNNIIKTILSKTNYKILSEEDNDDKTRLFEEIIWIVDPLDGTSDFIDKTGEFTIMIALIKNKKPIIGVIGWPTEKIIFAAQKDSGAFKFSKGKWDKISVTKISDLSKCKAVGSRHHLSEKEKMFIKKLGINNFTSIGSSLKVGMISSGEADVYLTTTTKMKEWDSAASYCLISEAGGMMTDMNGDDITYNNKNVNHQNGILVTNGLIHDIIIKKFKNLE